MVVFLEKSYEVELGSFGLSIRIMNLKRNIYWKKVITATFNSMRTPKLKAQPTNAFFATVNQMFGSSSQLPTIAGHCLVIWNVPNDLISYRVTEKIPPDQRCRIIRCRTPLPAPFLEAGKAGVPACTAASQYPHTAITFAGYSSWSFVITVMITDRIGLHSVLLPLLIIKITISSIGLLDWWLVSKSPIFY